MRYGGGNISDDRFRIKYDAPICLYMIVGEMPNNGGPFMVQVSASDKSLFEVIGNRWDNPELVKGE